MGDSVQSLPEVKVDNLNCSTFIGLSCHVIIEGYQIGQARFTLDESMSATPDDLLQVCILGDDLQNDLFHHLSKDRGEADWQQIFMYFIPELLLVY